MHSPTRAVLAAAVTDVAKAEGFTLAPDAADLIAIAADGSFRDALGVTQKVIMASGDAIGDADEVAAIIGAPKGAVVAEVLEGLSQKDAAKALAGVGEAVAAQADMKLFMRLLLERVRAVMLMRNMPNAEEKLLAAFSEKDAEQLKTLAAQSDSALNSHTLLRLLSAAEGMSRLQMMHLPLEVAIVEITQK